MTKIFWKSETYLPLLLEKVRVENVFFDFSSKYFLYTKDVCDKPVPYDKKKQFEYLRENKADPILLSFYSSIENDEFVIMKMKVFLTADGLKNKYLKRTDLSKQDSLVKLDAEEYDRIPIVSEYTKLKNFPERFAIKTENIDLIRELIAAGKRITWIDVNIIRFAPYLGIFRFENLVIDPCVFPFVIRPNGVVSKIELRDNHYWLDGVRSQKLSKMKHAKLIGFNSKFMLSRKRLGGLGRRAGIAKAIVSTGYPPKSSTADNSFYFNIQSITYMVWQLKNATTAKKNHVRKELKELCAQLIKER